MSDECKQPEDVPPDFDEDRSQIEETRVFLQRREDRWNVVLFSEDENHQQRTITVGSFPLDETSEETARKVAEGIAWVLFIGVEEADCREGET